MNGLLETNRICAFMQAAETLVFQAVQDHGSAPSRDHQSDHQSVLLHFAKRICPGKALRLAGPSRALVILCELQLLEHRLLGPCGMILAHPPACLAPTTKLELLTRID